MLTLSIALADVLTTLNFRIIRFFLVKFEFETPELVLHIYRTRVRGAILQLSNKWSYKVLC
jgi:hypothetical protein